MTSACVNPSWCQSLQRRKRVRGPGRAPKPFDEADHLINMLYSAWFLLDIEVVFAWADDAKTLRCVLPDDPTMVCAVITRVHKMLLNLGDRAGSIDALEYLMRFTTAIPEFRDEVVPPFTGGVGAQKFRCIALEVGYGDRTKLFSLGYYIGTTPTIREIKYDR